MKKYYKECYKCGQRNPSINNECTTCFTTLGDVKENSKVKIRNKPQNIQE